MCNALIAKVHSSPFSCAQQALGFHSYQFEQTNSKPGSCHRDLRPGPLRPRFSAGGGCLEGREVGDVISPEQGAAQVETAAAAPHRRVPAVSVQSPAEGGCRAVLISL